MRFFLGGLNLEVTVVCSGLKQDFSFVPDHEHENQESQPLDHQSKWLEAEPWLLFSLKKKKEFFKRTKVVKQAQSLLEAQCMWESMQRSSLFRTEAKQSSKQRKSVGVLTREGC